LLIVDTDILSMFAKADAVSVLVELIGQERIGMTPAIAEELGIPLQYGYDFPQKVFSTVRVVPLGSGVAEELIRLQAWATTLGKGEREAIAFCKAEGALFASNDAKARSSAQAEGVQVISLPALLRSLWVSGLKPKEEVRALLKRIQQADRLLVSKEVELEIFADDEG
jgi:predicted nucleic acid-binding protein